MKEINTHKRHKIFILCVCCLVFFIAVVSVFVVFQNHLKNNLYSTLINGVNKNIHNSKEHCELIIADTQRILTALEALNPDGFSDEWEMVTQNGHIRIDYIKPSEVSKILSSNISDSTNAILEKLSAGDEVTTDIAAPYFTNSDASFALLHPVIVNGGLTGILRADIDVALMIDNEDTFSFIQKIYTIITDTDGNIIYSNTNYSNIRDFFFSEFQNRIDLETDYYIFQSFKEDVEATIDITGLENKHYNKHYMAWETLSFNDWRIVNFSCSMDVVSENEKNFRLMILIGIFLIALTVIFCLILLRILFSQKNELDTSQRRYDALAQFDDTLLLEYDSVANRLIFTPNVIELLELDKKCAEGISREYYISNLIHPDDRDSIKESFGSLNFPLGETHFYETRIKCKNGKYKWFGCQLKSIENRGERTVKMLGKLVDISEQHEREEILRRATLEDALTGVYNRSVEKLINEQLKNNEQGLFLMIDLDDFKSINDILGHSAGDEALISVAQTLKEVFRNTDTIGRVGGDEFVVFISGENDIKVAEKKAEEIQRCIKKLCIGESGMSVSASIGIASAPKDGVTFGTLAHAADQTMYIIKRNGKQGFAVHDNDD